MKSSVLPVTSDPSRVEAINQTFSYYSRTFRWAVNTPLGKPLAHGSKLIAHSTHVTVGIASVVSSKEKHVLVS